MPRVVVSAPGKVLVCGGYLVVQRPNVGLSLALSSRFHVVVDHHSGAAQPARPVVMCHVRVLSKQFGTEHLVVLSHEAAGGGRLKVASDGGANQYILAGIVHSLAVAVARSADGPGILGRYTSDAPLVVRLFADNDFYSQANYLREVGLPLTTTNLKQQVPVFNRIVGALGKTGLGSSACLVTSLVAALLQHLGTVDLSGVRDADDEAKRRRVDDDDARALVHAVAQYTHCLAQGKVGSGFDVTSAVYGSILYTRFSPSRLAPALEGASVTEVCPAAFVSSIGCDVTPPSGWDHVAKGFTLPRGFKLLLGDVNKGASTPGMFSRYSKWRKEVGSAADKMILELAAANEGLVAALEELCSCTAAAPPEAAAHVVRKLSAVPAAEWGPVVDATAVGLTCLPASDVAAVRGFLSALTATANAFATQRRLQRQLGDAAGVEIEPRAQTGLLDATMKVGGVIGCGCPGAGGFDAVYAVCVDEDARQRVTEAWQFYRNDEDGVRAGSVCGLLVDEDKRRGLNLSTQLADWDTDDMDADASSEEVKVPMPAGPPRAAW